jgi:hypothetical protein
LAGDAATLSGRFGKYRVVTAIAISIGDTMTSEDAFATRRSVKVP